MPISITLTGDTVADLRTQAAVLLGLSDGAVTHVAEAARPAPQPANDNKPQRAARTTKPAEQKPAAEPPKELPNDDDISDVGVVEQPKAEAPTIEAVTDVGKELAAAKGVDALRAMLKDFEAERISKIPEAKWADWIASCKAKIAA